MRLFPRYDRQHPPVQSASIRSSSAPVAADSTLLASSGASPFVAALLVVAIEVVAQLPVQAQLLIQSAPSQLQIANANGNTGSTSPAAQQVVFVNPMLGNDAADGSQRSPFRTITHALQLAQPNTVIMLATGTYSTETGEQFPLIMKPGVTIQGDPGTQGSGIVIRGGGTFLSPTSAGQNITLLGADQAQLVGVTVTNPDPRGYGLWAESTDPTVMNSTFTNNGHDGISTVGDSAPRILSSIFVQNGANGITIFGASHPEVRENVFERTGFGVNISEQATPLLVDNQISQNKIGVLVQENARPVLRGNTIEGSLQGGVVAIANAQPDLGTASDPGNNVFRNNAQADINAASSSQTIPAFGNQLVATQTQGKVDLAGTVALTSPPASTVSTRPNTPASTSTSTSVSPPGATSSAPPAITPPSSMPGATASSVTPTTPITPPIPVRSMQAAATPQIYRSSTETITQLPPTIASSPLGLNQNSTAAPNPIVTASANLANPSHTTAPVPITTVPTAGRSTSQVAQPFVAATARSTAVSANPTPTIPAVFSSPVFSSSAAASPTTAQISTPPPALPRSRTSAVSTAAIVVPPPTEPIRPVSAPLSASPSSRSPSSRSQPAPQASIQPAVQPAAAIEIPVPPPETPAQPVAVTPYRRPAASAAPTPPARQALAYAAPAPSFNAPINIPVPIPESSPTPPARITNQVPSPPRVSNGNAPNLLPVPDGDAPIGNIGDMPTVAVSRNPLMARAVSSSSSSNRRPANLKYRVVVDADNEQEQSMVQSLVPSAFLTSVNGRALIQVGAFSSRDNAEQAVQLLSQSGLRAVIQEMD